MSVSDSFGMFLNLFLSSDLCVSSFSCCLFSFLRCVVCIFFGGVCLFYLFGFIPFLDANSERTLGTRVWWKCK